MIYINTNGYKMIFSIEKLLRNYISTFIDAEQLSESIKNEAKRNALKNGVEIDDRITEYLEWLHIGNLYDLINSRDFKTIKSNSLNEISITDLLHQRNNIMHSREIYMNELDKIKENCDKIVEKLDYNQSKVDWLQICSEIDNLTLPEVFIEYPIGKDFIKLLGRDKELIEISENIKYPMPLTIIGQGGLGKTALVLQLIENYLYSPNKPFNKMLFMSFKDTSYFDGKLAQFEKSIRNYDDLIERIGISLEVEGGTDRLDYTNRVINKLFDDKILLIIDNLETEIVRSNMKEFLDLNQKFISNFQKPSRLIITSRLGLGDKESKYLLDAFDELKTLDFLKSKLENTNICVDKYSGSEISWITEYTQGNPSLIIALSNTIKNSNKEVSSIMLEYKAEFSSEFKELERKKEAFLNFCFENTLDVLNEEQIKYLHIISYVCNSIKIFEVSVDFIAYLNDELGLEKKLGLPNLDRNILENIGFLQKRGTSYFYVNEMIIKFITQIQEENKLYLGKVRDLDYFIDIQELVNEVKNNLDSKCSMQALLQELYKSKYRKTRDSKYLFYSFLCNPNIESYIMCIRNASDEDSIQYVEYMARIKRDLMNNKYIEKQEEIIDILLNKMISIREKVKRKEDNEFRQEYLLDHFQCMKDNIGILGTKKLNIKLREKICNYFNMLGNVKLAEEYLTNNENEMLMQRFDIYTRLIGLREIPDETKAKYIEKCQNLIDKKEFIHDAMYARFYINTSNYYLRNDPKKVFEWIDKVPANKETPTEYANYLQVLLIKAEAMIKNRTDLSNVQEIVNLFKIELSSENYKKMIWMNKQKKLESQLNRIESKIAKYK